MIKKTIKDFIKEAKIIHEDKYDYSLSKYINNNTKLIIICNEHGILSKNLLNILIINKDVQNVL